MAKYAFALISALLVGKTSAQDCYESDMTRDMFAFCKKVAPNVNVYYGEQGEFMKLGMEVFDHSGWSAVAMAGNGGMKGARQIVVRKVNDVFVAEDRYSLTYVTPALQETQDVLLMFANEGNGNINWGVLVPLNSCKGTTSNGMPTNYPIEDVDQWMHWALGATHEFSYHSNNRGPFLTNLISGPTEDPGVAGLAKMSIRMPDVPVVADESAGDKRNPYICGLFDLSKLLDRPWSGEKNHAVRFAPKLDPASAQYVHHLLFFECLVDEDGDEEKEGEQLFNRSSWHNTVISECSVMPDGCFTITWQWAVGGEGLVLPPDVGMPIGERTKFVAVQMHYYNPELTPDVRDSSGMDIYFTEEPRAIDAGLLQFNGGTNDDMREPLAADETAVSRTFQVPGTCTKNWAEDELTIVGVAYHAHYLGTRISIDVVRDGENVGTLRTQNGYDFNHQSLAKGPVSKLRPGDAFNMRCQYDTSNKAEPTPFGAYTSQEMCLGSAVYYPRVDVSVFAYGTKLATEQVAQAQMLATVSCSMQAKSNPALAEPIRMMNAARAAFHDQEERLAALPPDVSDLSSCEAGMMLAPVAVLMRQKPDESASANLTTRFRQNMESDVASGNIAAFCKAWGVSPALQKMLAGACPECALARNCTWDDYSAYSAAYCQSMCVEEYGLSLYPDQSDMVPFALSDMTFCNAQKFFEAFEVPAMTCQVRGDVSSEAAAGIKADMLSLAAGKQAPTVHQEDAASMASTSYSMSLANAFGAVMLPAIYALS